MANVPLPVVDHGFDRALREYQRVGISFLFRREAAILADDMGLGKTAQAIGALRLILRSPEINRALVVAPASLTLNWEREIARWAPEVVVRRLVGTQNDRLAYYDLPIPVLISSYEQIRIDAFDRISDGTFDLVLLDEAQRIKNYGSRTALACRLISRKISWALSGTPLENSRSDLEAVFSFLCPGLLRRSDNREAMLEKIAPYFLRRRKADVLPELPPILVQDLAIEMTEPQRRAYDAAWDAGSMELRDSPHPVPAAAMLALITRLKQICNADPQSGDSCKLDALRIVFESAMPNKLKIIVFSQYVKTLKWLIGQLEMLSVLLYSGESAAAERDSVLQRFEREPGPQVLFCSLRAGGLGLNIPAADLVVLFDRWWNPAVEDQAISRAHRFGRTAPLHVIRFAIRDSIEERIIEILEQKRKLFTEYIETVDRPDVDLLTRGELIRILGLSHYEMDVQPQSVTSEKEPHNVESDDKGNQRHSTQ